MKIIDIDWVQTKKHAQVVNSWVLDSCYIDQASLRNNYNTKAIPREAIYFFSTKHKSKEVLKEMGIEFVGNWWKDISIQNMLEYMILEISEFKIKNEMMPIFKFEGKVPVFVLTNRELQEIEVCNAIPILPIMLGLN